MSAPTPPLEDPKIKLYWLEKSRSQRILWLLEELKVPYEVETFKRTAEMLAPPELKEIHPLGKSPLISIKTAAAAEPMVLAESGFIVEYLTDHFGTWLQPKRYAPGKEGQLGGETEEWLRYRFFMHYAEGSLMIHLVVAFLMQSIRNAPVPFFIKPITSMITGKVESKFLRPNFVSNFGFIESQLETSPNNGEYLCGTELTGADVLMIFPLDSAKTAGKITAEKYPKLSAYVERIAQREAYQRAVQKIVELEGAYHASL